jgi:hypothetical protein
MSVFDHVRPLSRQARVLVCLEADTPAAVKVGSDLGEWQCEASMPGCKENAENVALFETVALMGTFSEPLIMWILWWQ